MQKIRKKRNKKLISAQIPSDAVTVQRTIAQLRSSAMDLLLGVSPAPDTAEQNELTDLQPREHHHVGKEV
jgi:hypothetical protein